MIIVSHLLLHLASQVLGWGEDLLVVVQEVLDDVAGQLSVVAGQVGGSQDHLQECVHCQ